MPKMRASFQGLVRVLAKSLYPEPEVFVRELLQNAHDSIQLRRIEDAEWAGEIRIDVDEGARTLSFRDNGTGMDRREIEDFLSVIGGTGTGSRAQELAARDVAVATIGQFGIGLLSAFVVAERIDVYTRKPGAPQTWRWTTHGGEDYDLVALPADAQPPGTRVVVTLAPRQTAFLDGQLLRRIVRRYADLLPFPILLDGLGPLNAINAPWHEPGWRDPVERDRLLTGFLSQRYADALLLVIPVDLPCPRTLGGLYVAARYAPGGQAGGLVDLFQARMCVRPNDRELLPEWAPFVRGLVDCPDLQPTAARDNVLRDSVYHALREALGKTIVAALLELAARDRPRFLRLCDWHQDALKGMAAQHPEFGAAVLDFLPFATNQGQLTLPEYLARQPREPDGKRPLYFFTHEADANQFYPLCQAHGVLAINAGGAFDEALLRRYVNQHPDRVHLKPLDRFDDPALYPPLDAAAQARYAPLTRAVDQALAEAGVAARARIRQFQPADLSAVVLSGHRLTAFDRMEQMLEKSLLTNELAELAGEVRDRLRDQPLDLLLNAAHPLVRRLSELADLDHPRYRPVLRGLYYSALLNARHRLTPAAARHFYADLQALLAAHLDLQAPHDP